MYYTSFTRVLLHYVSFVVKYYYMVTASLGNLTIKSRMKRYVNVRISDVREQLRNMLVLENPLVDLTLVFI